MCASNISTDQDQTDLRVSTWLLRGLKVCNVGFVWTTMIPLLNYLINALPIPLALSTIATIVTCAPEPITTEPTPTRHLKKQADLYLQRCELDWNFAGGLVPFCACKLIVVDILRLNDSGPSLFPSEEIRIREDNKLESESEDVRM